MTHIFYHNGILFSSAKSKEANLPFIYKKKDEELERFLRLFSVVIILFGLYLNQLKTNSPDNTAMQKDAI